MIIKKVIIENFRIYSHKEFEFGENQLILITGANGFGKTTLIDAIEWCLTGDIGRIKRCYRERNSNQTEKNRPENKKGIIKNSHCKPNDQVKVTITLLIDNLEVTVYRKQKEDSLYANTQLKFEDEISDDKKDKIKNYAANDKFYNYHVCDTYKSYEFLNSKRQEVKEKFEDFIKPHPLADSLSKKLELLQKKLEEDIKNKQNSVVKTEEYTKELDSLKKELKQLDYPQITIYDEENLNIENEKIEEIEKQQVKIKKCGYNVAASKIEHVILYYQAIEKAEKVNKMIEIATTMGNDLNIAIAKSYYDSAKLDEIKNRIKIVLDEKQKIEGVKKIDQIDTTVQPEIYAEISNYISVQKDNLAKMKVEINNKQNIINDIEKGNEIITALSNLVVGREGFLKYRNEGNSQCPLCGSKEKFEKIIKSDELAGEAQAYLDKSKSNLGIMKKEKQDIATNVNKIFDALKKYINKHLEEKLKILEEQKTIFSDFYNKTKDFFDRLRNLNISIDSKYIENLEIEKNKLDKIKLEKDTVNCDMELIKNILTANQLSYSLENISSDTLKKVQLDVALLIDQSVSVINFTFEEYNKKLLFINNLLNNKKVIEKQLQIDKYEEQNNKTRNEIINMEKAKAKAKKIRDSIEAKKTRIEKLELEAVGPYLYKIFSKVIKHTNVEEIKFNRDGSKGEGGATVTDQDDNNILNILSQGQFGVFMLSFFFANMFKRKEETEFKTYFVDDITSCMDDMNVLSFVDIIKYQLYQKDGVINQFFFSTCSDDLERLFIHKMKSFGIKFVNVKFKSYAKGEMLNSQGQIEQF